jgi:hypothetical protein
MRDGAAVQRDCSRTEAWSEAWSVVCVAARTYATIVEISIIARLSTTLTPPMAFVIDVHLLGVRAA